jgi:transcriptional regulator GlxA family with amidase domain
MREAEHLITTTTLPLSAIFLKVGVSDRSHFVRKFRQFYGLAPSTYRAERRLEKGTPIQEV